MPTLIGNETHFEGLGGRADLIPVAPTDRNAEFNCGSWFLFAPQAHPLWSYHVLYVVKLVAVEGQREPNLHFLGATHEIGVIALNPEFGIETAEQYLAFMRPEDRTESPWLSPNDVCEQFEATDDEAKLIATYCAWGVANGVLIPDEDYRRQWLPSIVQTLAHIRGEEHGDLHAHH